MGSERPRRRGLVIYKHDALRQMQFLTTRGTIYKCEQSIKEKSELLAELEQNGDREEIADIRHALSDLREDLRLAERNLMKLHYSMTPSSGPVEPYSYPADRW